jgi:hypothetical protein
MSVSRTTVQKAKANYTPILAACLPVDTDLNAFVAVIAVEAGGDGIDVRYNRPIIRFEVHKFYELHGYVSRSAFDQRFKFNPTKKWMDHFYCTPQAPTTWIQLHVGTRDNSQIHEWYALNVAMQLDSASAPRAIESCSWGAGQIMGFHWKRLGYASPMAMMQAAGSMQGQIQMMVNFIISDPKLYTALKAKDWKTFARIYNGSGQVDTYSKWLADAYALTMV